MKPLFRQPRSLQLEYLETRTLLAADLAADFELAAKALTGSGPFDASFSINFGNTQLVLTGHGTETLSVDLDRLPAFVTNLRISSFSSVTFSGTDHVDSLVVSDVTKFSAPDLSVTKSLHVNNVASVDLASAGVIAVLNGTDTSLSVGSLESTMIISDLHTLTLDSQTRELYVIGLNSEQTLNLKYRPETISLAGLTSASVHMVDDLASPPPSSNPTEPVASTGNHSGSSPVPAEKPVTIITLPLDERTRHFLAELRDVVHGTGKDSEQIVSEFMAHNGLTAIGAGPTPPKLVGTPAEALRPDVENLIRAAGIVGGLSSPSEAPKADANPTGNDRPLHAPELGIQTPGNFRGWSSVSAPALDIDATWPLAMPGHANSESARPFLPPRKEVEPVELKLEDSVRAFGNYVVERVSAEFSPGEQSLILLVDPKPTRAAGFNPTSALEAFARGGSHIVSNLGKVEA